MGRTNILLIVLATLGLSLACASTKPTAQNEDRYAEYVWPAPPDEPKVRLVDVIGGRADVEASSRFEAALIGAQATSPYDRLKRPIGVAYDPQGRILVSDVGLAAIVRFDRVGRIMDVLGTSGSLPLKAPLGLTVSQSGVIWIADAGQKKVIGLDERGKLVLAIGKTGDLENPTDVAVSNDGKSLYVTDSKQHKIVIFDIATGSVTGSIGKRGEQPGEFNFPTSLGFDRKNGELFVVDQINARVQILGDDGDVIDVIGSLGTGFGQFVRPKDVAIDDFGIIYVTDGAFNNVQLFNYDLQLLTFIGTGGVRPGEFQVAGSISVHGDEFVIVDQLNRRIQVFRYIKSRS